MPFKVGLQASNHISITQKLTMPTKTSKERDFTYEYFFLNIQTLATIVKMMRQMIMGTTTAAMAGKKKGK